MEQAKEMLSRTPVDCNPVLVLNKDKKCFYEFTVDDFSIEGYQTIKPQLKFEVAV